MQDSRRPFLTVSLQLAVGGGPFAVPEKQISPSATEALQLYAAVCGPGKGGTAGAAGEPGASVTPTGDTNGGCSVGAPRLASGSAGLFLAVVALALVARRHRRSV